MAPKRLQSNSCETIWAGWMEWECLMRKGLKVLHRCLWSLTVLCVLVVVAGCGTVEKAGTLGDYEWVQMNASATLPATRSGACAVYDTDLHRLLVFGGAYLGSPVEPGKYFDDLWSYDPATNRWTELQPSGDAPTPGDLSYGVYDEAGGRFLLLGGSGEGMQSTSDPSRLWAYDASSNRWTELHPGGAVPPALEAPSVAYDSTSGRMLLFGGRTRGDSGDFGQSAFSNELYAYDSSSNIWERIVVVGPRPEARYGQAMAYDCVDNALIIIGGVSFQSAESPESSPTDDELIAHDDAWQLDLTTSIWKELSPTGSLPSPIGLAAAFDAQVGLTVAYSGIDNRGQEKSSLIILDVDHSQWREVERTGSWPSPRVMPTLVYDRDINGFLMYGGTRTTMLQPSLDNASSPFVYFDEVWIYAPK